MSKSKTGIVNVRMVITEEKILSNIDKVQKMINPNSKKQIVQLEEDTYFKDLVESIKTYLIEYPKKKNFPSCIYKAAYGLVEYATNQFEENTKRIEELIRQREQNIGLASQLKDLVEVVDNKEKDWKDQVKKAEDDFPEDVIETLNIIGKSKGQKSQNYQDAMKLLHARINNLESNLHIEIDMERIEDRSKALSYIGIEVADALKSIPAPIEEIEEAPMMPEVEEPVAENVAAVKVKAKGKSKIAAIVPENGELQSAQISQEESQTETAKNEYVAATTFEEKPSLWQRIKNSKIVRAIRYVMKIKVVLDYPALPEGKGENY